MSQKQAKRLRRIEQDISTLYNVHRLDRLRMARIEEQLYHKLNTKPSLWHKVKLWLQH